MKTYKYASGNPTIKTFRIKFEAWLKIIITIIFLYPTIIAQQEIDTLYIFPDTTTFFDHDNGLVTDDMANFAVKLIPDISWMDYKVESVCILFFNIGIEIPVFLKISIGNIPEEVVLYQKNFILNSTYSYFPIWHTFVTDSAIFITSQGGPNHFFISGTIFLGTAGSIYSYPLKMNQYYFNPFNSTWYEGLPVFLPAKVIVSKVFVGITEANTDGIENKVETFPNPFNSVTKIKYSISNSDFVTLKICDILGNEVATLVNEEKPAGSYELNFDASSFPSGVYIVRLTACNFSAKNKITLLK